MGTHSNAARWGTYRADGLLPTSLEGLPPQPCTPPPEPRHLPSQRELSHWAAPQNQPKTLALGWEPLAHHRHLSPQKTLCSSRSEGSWGWGWPGARGDGGPSEEPLVLEGAQLSAGRVFFFLPCSLLSSLSAEMAMPGCSELTIIAAV